MQTLWLCGTGWDEPLDSNHVLHWTKIDSDLTNLNNVRIPRWTNYRCHSVAEIHGFADASERAYAAAVYLRVSHEGECKVSLLTAKTKVAPLEQVSLPRLELCAGVLLVRLVSCICGQTPSSLWPGSRDTRVRGKLM